MSKLINKATIVQLKSLVRKSTDKQIEDFLTNLCLNFYAEQIDAKVVDTKRCLVVGDEIYEFTCPNCGEVSQIDMKSLLDEQW